MISRTVYTSAAVNTNSHCFDCFPNPNFERIVAYGSGSAVILCDCVYNTTGISVLCDLPQDNTATPYNEVVPDVTCLTFTDDGSALLVGNTAGQLLLITPEPGFPQKSFRTCWEHPTLSAIAKAKGSIQSVSTVTLPDGVIAGIAVAADGSVLFLSKQQHEEWAVVQQTKGPLAECTTINYLFDEKGTTTVVAAIGGVDKKVRLFEKTAREYKQLPSLSQSTTWMSCLDSCRSSKGIYLAGGSQDGRARVWHITKQNVKFSQVVENNSLFPAGYTITLDSLVKAHSDFVTGVMIKPYQSAYLLTTASLDRTMATWFNSEEQRRVWGIAGDVLGGNVLGFRCGKGTSGGSYLCGVGYHGALHVWSAEGPLPSATGHAGAITGSTVLDTTHFPPLIVTVGYDKTARVHAAVLGSTDSQIDKRCNPETTEVEQNASKRQRIEAMTWREIARATVHGHAIECVDKLGGLAYVIGSDEGPFRIFLSPQTFLDSVATLCGEGKFLDASKKHHLGLERLYDSRPYGASLPPLGLSTRPLTREEAQAGKGKGDSTAQLDEFCSATPEALQSPPLEERLTQHTLWPEGGKCMGHPTTAKAVAAHTYNGLKSIIAGTCDVVKVTDSMVLLWSYVDSVAVTENAGLNVPHKLTAFLIPGNEKAIDALQFDSSGNSLALGGTFLSVVSRKHSQSETFTDICNSWQQAAQNITEHITTSCSVKPSLEPITSLSWVSDMDETKAEQHIAVGHQDGTLSIWKYSANEEESKFNLELVLEKKVAESAITAIHAEFFTKANDKIGIYFGTKRGELHRIEASLQEGTPADVISNISQRIHGNKISGLVISRYNDVHLLATSSWDQRMLLLEVPSF